MCSGDGSASGTGSRSRSSWKYQLPAPRRTMIQWPAIMIPWTRSSCGWMKAAICLGGCHGVKSLDGTRGSSSSDSSTGRTSGSIDPPLKQPPRTLTMRIKAPKRVVLFAKVDLLRAESFERDAVQKDDRDLAVGRGGDGGADFLHPLRDDLPQLARGSACCLIAG